jgi:hypothetical protein
VSHSNSFVRDHFNSERSKSIQSKKKAVAYARDLMDDAARVCSLEYEAAFDSYSNKRNAGMIASSVLDSYLHRNAAHQGFLSQANHVICKGVNYQQLTDFEAAISALEQDNGGLTMTSSGVNLSSSCAAKQVNAAFLCNPNLNSALPICDQEYGGCDDCAQLHGLRQCRPWVEQFDKQRD